MNSYTIIEFDTNNKQVLVDYVYNGQSLRDRIFIDDFSNKEILQVLIESNYKKFIEATSLTKAIVISDELISLVGVVQEVTNV